MTATPLQRIACLFGRHHRSHKRAWALAGPGPNSHIAPCRGCGTPMIKRSNSWHPMSRAERREFAADIARLV
ncbi:MAG: hypothetical protein K2Y20_06030 [Sphingomonas sp.]|nr:hypothetical protein [Sphingomonas sp.]